MAQRVYGFTLAEVLITLVIIGIIAALTIPNLLQKYTEQVTVKKVKKFYSTLSNSYALAMKDNGKANEWGLAGNYDGDSTEKIYELLFKPYFKIAKNCGRSNTGNCIANQYKNLNNNDSTRYTYGGTTSMYKVTLDDGAAIFWYTTGDNARVVIVYDTNGIKLPNQWGKDTFLFAIRNGYDKIYPSGIPSIYGTNLLSTCSRNGTTSFYCAAWVVYKGNMDYLHCDDLSWTGKDKCSK